MSLRFAILGLIAHSPRSGYDIKRDFERSASHVWNASGSQIYPTLSELEDLGLIEQAKFDSGERRQEFSITPSGLDTLQQWLSRVAITHVQRDPLLLKLFLLDLATPEVRYRQLLALIDDQKKYVAECERHINELKSDPGEVQWRLSSWQLELEITRARLGWATVKLANLVGSDSRVAALEQARQVSLTHD